MVYIQSNEDRSLAHHFDCSCALYGAVSSAMRYRLTTFDEVSSGKFDALINKHLFVGSVEFMREVFRRAGIGDVRVPRNSNRNCEITTLGDAINRILSGETLFVKPVEIKLFTGAVLNRANYQYVYDISRDALVMVYQPFSEEIVSEWRLYIHNNKIVDSRNYFGDFKISPNYRYAESIVEDNRSEFPCSYTIDIGILENGDNVVVEFNDMWAIGNYGTDNTLYLRMLRDRYFQIIQNNS